MNAEQTNGADVESADAQTQKNQQLLQTLKRMNQLLEVTPVLIAVLNREGKILFINKSLTEIDAADLIGQSIFDFIQEPAQHEFEQLMDRVLKSHVPEHIYEKLFIDTLPDRMFHIEMKPLDSPSEERIVMFATDQTERLAQEQEIRQSEEKYKYLFDRSTNGIILLDAFMNVVDLNQMACRMLVQRSEDMIGHTFLNVVPEEQLELLPDMMNQINTGDHVQEKFVLIAGARNITVEMNAQRLPDGKILLVLFDLTESMSREQETKKIEQQMQQAQRLESIGVMAGGIAHEFNNILTPIIGYTDLLMNEAQPGTSQEKNLTYVRDSAQRAKELVEQLMTFSRSGADTKQKLEIHIIVKEAMKLLRASIPSNVSIIERIKKVPAIQANPSQVHQIITQLCSNAANSIKDDQGAITIVLTTQDIEERIETALQPIEAGRYVMLQISDTGKGIEQSIITRIFDPFFTTNEIAEGSGMGLSIVHGIVKGHNGSINVTSEPGKGTSFSIYFPIEEKRRLDKKVNLIPVSDESVMERVLVVDDEKEVANLFEILLKRKGYEVIKFTSPLDAVSYFKEQKSNVDLVITDQTMPSLLGIDLAGRVKEIRPDIPVILLTGYSDLFEGEDYRAKGVDTVLTKPVVPQLFYDKIRAILDR